MTIEEKLLELYENLYTPFEKKEIGRYWLVSNNKRPPVKTAEELLEYIQEENHKITKATKKNKTATGSFISNNGNLTTKDLLIEGNIFLDFDLTPSDYLKAEDSLTETVLEEIAKTDYTITENTKTSEKAKLQLLEQIQLKYNKYYDIDNGFIKGYNNFIDSLATEEAAVLKGMVKDLEAEEVKGLSEKEVQKYYIDKFEQDYLKAPFKEAVTVAKYFESVGIKSIINWSGSKGLHLRLPITLIDFSEVPELEGNPEALKLFLLNMAELIETELLNTTKNESSIDYAVFKRGLQRIPCSKHEKTKLYANFIESSTDYLTAIDYLEESVPVYVPEVIDKVANTEAFIESGLYKKSVEKTVNEVTATFKNENINSNYEFNGQHKELLENIIKVYLPSVRNEIGFRIIHLLKRSGFKKEDVESIFKQLHETAADYNETIKGSINHAYNTDKLVGLKNLIEWLNNNAPLNVKEDVIDYFSNNFNINNVPEVTILKDKFFYNGTEYSIQSVETDNGRYYNIKDFTQEGLNLEYHALKNYIMVRKDKEAVGKLRLLKTVDSIEAADKTLKRFDKKLNVKGIKLDFEEILEELDLLFTESKNLQQLLQEEEEKSPIEKLTDSPKNSGALMEFSKDYLEPIGQISVSYNKDTKKKEQYIYNNGYYEKVTLGKVQKFIEDRFKLRLPEDSIKTLIGSISVNNTFNYNYFQFDNNIFFNGVTGKFEEKPEGFLTDKKVGMTVKGKYKFVKRLTEEELNADTIENGYSDLEEIVYTIMSVPENTEESIRRYKGFLEWVGYIFRPVNTNKKIINLEGPGDDGKSTLLDILLKIIPDYSVVIIPKELKKEFTEAMLANNHLIAFDEAKTSEVVEHEIYIKNASNGRSNRSSRQMYTDESIDNLKFGLIFILSNDPITFNPSDEALMERQDIIHMFRRFKQTPDKSKGELKAKDVDSILDNDFRGFERIVNYGIIEYNKIRNDKQFSLSTSITETKEILIGNDILKQFLAVKTRYDKASTVTNEVLTTAFLKWSEKKGINLKDHFNYKNENSLKTNVKIKLGRKIKEHYRDIKEEDLVELNEDRKVQYCIRILSNSEVAERDSTKYCINEDSRAVYKANSLIGTNKIVYNAVHSLTEASINDLIKETDVPEVELIKILTKLEQWDYIEEI